MSYRSYREFTPALLAAVLGLTLGFPALGAADEPLPVTAAAYHLIAEERVFDGVVEAVKQSTVAAQVSARIDEIHFDVDDVVPKGAVLIRFRDKEQKARLAEAKAAREEAKARFDEAETEFRRMKNLYERKLVSAADRDRAAAAYAAAQARMNATEAQIQTMQETLANTVVRAPYGGIVVARHVEVGETVQAGQPLMTGLSLDQLRVLVQLPQSIADSVRGTARARVLLGTETPRSVAASSVTVFPYADVQSHSVKVRLGLPDGTGGIYPGAFVKAAFALGEQRRLVVPRQAVAQRSEVTAVYVVDDSGRISMRQIRPGARFDDVMEVLAGISEGERVALDPVQAALLLKQQAARHE